MATDYFLDAFGDPELGLKMREKNPENLDAALRIALQLEVWTKDSYRLQQAETPRPSENKRNRKITKMSQQSALEKKNEALQKEIAEAKKTIENIRKNRSRKKERNRGNPEKNGRDKGKETSDKKRAAYW